MLWQLVITLQIKFVTLKQIGSFNRKKLKFSMHKISSIRLIILIFKCLLPFFLYVNFLVNKIRYMDTLFFKWLVKKNVLFGYFFNGFKAIFFLVNIYWFTKASIGFYADVWKLENEAFYFAIFSFLLVQLSL